MINYISSEIFRAKHRKILILLIIAGFLIPASYANQFYTQGINEYQEYGDSLTFISYLLQPAAIIIGLGIIAFVYKKKEIYRIYLSQGYTKLEIYFYDLITMEVLTILIGFLLCGIVVGVTYVMSMMTGYDHLINLKFFILKFLVTLVIQMAANCLLLAIAYITDSKFIAIVGFFVMLFIYISSYGVQNEFYRNLLLELSPYRLNEDGIALKVFSLKEIFYLFRYLAINTFLGYQGIRRREF